MNIYISKRNKISSKLSEAEIKSRLNAILKNSSKMDFGNKASLLFLGIDTKPEYEGHIGKTNFSISPVFRGKELFVFYSADGAIKANGQGAVIDVKMQVTDIIQKVTFFVFFICAFFIAAILIMKQEGSLFVLFLAGVFYLFFTIAAMIGYSKTNKLLKKMLER